VANPAQIKVEGMKELRKALRDLSDDKGWRAELREAYRAVSSLVEGEARSRAGSGQTTLAGTGASMGSRAIASIRGKGTTTGATLEGGKGVAWFGGWNFGSGGAYRQFPARRDPDYTMYAAVEEKRAQITDEFAEAVETALQQAFPE